MHDGHKGLLPFIFTITRNCSLSSCASRLHMSLTSLALCAGLTRLTWVKLDMDIAFLPDATPPVEQTNPSAYRHAHQRTGRKGPSSCTSSRPVRDSRTAVTFTIQIPLRCIHQGHAPHTRGLMGRSCANIAALH